mgnify:CR=1 FL=1
MEPSEATKEHLTDLTVDVVMELRRMYLSTGANALKHWDQITDRVRAATRTCAGPEEWVTKLCRDLQIAAPSSSLSSAAEALTEAARRYGAAAWLALVEREYAFMIARARRLAEERRAEKLEAAAQAAKENAS